MPFSMPGSVMNDRRGIFLENIHFSYDGGSEVLKIKRFDLPVGKISVLRGGNGSGKTTLLKLLSGLLGPNQNGKSKSTTGGVRLSGSVYIHQEPYVLRGSVYKNMKLSSNDSGVIKKALGEVDLGGFEKREARKLSGGEQKRLALARAFAAGPSIYLLDEPTANVDKGSVVSLENAFKGIAASGSTVLVATHHSSFGYRIADHLFTLENGCLEKSHENILRGRVEKSDSHLLFFRTGNKLIRCPSITGGFTTAVVGYEDIILSNDAIQSSAQNTFPGTVVGVSPGKSGVYVHIDCGFPLSCKVTDVSIEKLNIETGKTIYVNFKALAVRLY
jgi:tungstate transport system ATP-binding protein